ncbi:hypothetical protein [Azohydromonas aeria]|nr:hypothetical protein [Azohydromonas aeria]
MAEFFGFDVIEAAYWSLITVLVVFVAVAGRQGVLDADDGR